MSKKIVSIVLLGWIGIAASQEIVPFDDPRWQITGGRITDHLDRTALEGGEAVLNGVTFQDGVIEVDMAVSGQRGFAGINFRVGEDGQYEHFYIRPHKSGLPDALQYTPVFHGLSSWQLYNGTGYTAAAPIPTNQWIHIKLEIKGSQGRVFLDGADTPALVMGWLQHGKSKGTIGLFGPPRGAVYFANFAYRLDGDLAFDPPQDRDIPYGLLMDWEISQAIPLAEADFEAYPTTDTLDWLSVSADTTGLVDVARYRAPVQGDASLVYARTFIMADKVGPVTVSLGYSDVIQVFANGKPVFSGNNAFLSRDPAFQGIVGRNDEIVLPLKKGRNELLINLAESMGGWGFTFQRSDAVKSHPKLKKSWQIPAGLNMPESALWDGPRARFIITNYGLRAPRGSQDLSLLDAQGQMLERHWAKGLDHPCGLTVWDGKLYVVERTGLAEIEMETGEILRRLPFPRPRFPNDVTVDEQGVFYVTDSFAGVIYRWNGQAFEPWLDAPVEAPNGICYHDGLIVWGNNGDGCLKSVNLKTGEVRIIAHLGAGTLDGIAWDLRGFYLVSHFSGRLFKVTPQGRVTVLLDTSAEPLNLADFCYIANRGLFVIPSLYTNRLTAFTMDDQALGTL